MSDDMFSASHLDDPSCFGGACVPERRLALGSVELLFFLQLPLVDEAVTCACHWLDSLRMGSRTRLRIPN